MLNREIDRGIGLTLGAGVGATVVTAGALLLFAIEGAICILMAVPIGLVAVLVGAAMGRVVATILRTTTGPGPSGAGPTVACIVLIPMLAGLEHVATPVTVYEVRSSVEVAASTDVVWQNVIAFPDLPPARSGSSTPASRCRCARASKAKASAPCATASSAPGPSSSRSPRGSPVVGSRST